MYTIIGADGAEYGPVSEAQVRAWVAGRRADAATRIRRQGETEWSTIGDLPEFSRESHEPPPLPGGNVPVADASAAEIADSLSAQAGRVEIGAAYERAWGVLKGDFWRILGVTLLITVSQVVIQQVISRQFSAPAIKGNDPEAVLAAASQLSSMFLFVMPLVAVIQVLFSSGLQYYYLMHLRGEKPTLGDAFKGFSRPGPLIVLAILTQLLTLLGFLFLVLPGIYLAVALSFGPILVLDKGLSGTKAMGVSRRLISRQWFTLFGMMILGVLLILAGICALLVGVFVALPLVQMAIVVAYDEMVSPRKPRF